MEMKEISDEGRRVSANLGKYIPTYDEFVAYIGHLDPKSAWGPSGLTYLLVQYWPNNVK
jgi:hypothetical protein